MDTTTKVNGYALSENVTLGTSDITGLTTALGGKAMTGNITLEMTDIVEEVTQLSTSGVLGELVAYDGKLYVWTRIVDPEHLLDAGVCNGCSSPGSLFLTLSSATSVG